MALQDPREYTKVLRDPVHDYVAIPDEILPVVQSPYVQRLRNVSQNSRAIAAYPSLNGSRFEHALGTMHLSMKAWRNAWSSFWGDDPDGQERDADSLRIEFARAVRSDLMPILKTREQEDEFTAAILLNRSRNEHQREGEWLGRFSDVMELAVGVVGLLHDVGHPPFSHVLEDPYNQHSDRIFRRGFLDSYRDEQKNAPDTQFHEYASGQIVHQILRDKNLSSRLPVLLIEAIFDARGDEGGGAPEWAKCVHQLIDGQIDVDRLDYISRDSLRAGTNYHAIDHSRLIGNLELHRQVRPDGQKFWTVGLGIRGISAMESLLLQREQSYRWMIFHPKALIADTALKRVFDHAIEAVDDLPELDYVTKWLDSGLGGVSSSYCVDDHSVVCWLRKLRNEIPASERAGSRLHALMRIWDEVSPDYFAAWRTYGEYTEALESGQELLGSLIAALAPGDPVPVDSERASVAKDQDVVAHVFNKFVRTAWQSELREGRQIDVVLEEELNRLHGSVADVDGTWVVAQRLSFRPIKAGKTYVWSGNRRIRFEDLSPLYSGLRDAEHKRPIIWAFFVPYLENQSRQPEQEEALKKQVSRLFLETIVEKYTEISDPEEGKI